MSRFKVVTDDRRSFVILNESDEVVFTLNLHDPVMRHHYTNLTEVFLRCVSKLKLEVEYGIIREDN